MGKLAAAVAMIAGIVASALRTDRAPGPPDTSRKARRRARQLRLHRYQWALRRTFAKRAKERYGLDVEGPANEVADARRLMRNARKAERHA